MLPDTETEMKLTASAAKLDALRAHPALAGPETCHLLDSTYFDTIGSRLGRRGAGLRVRRGEDGEREQTLKLVPTAGSPLRRREWTVKIAGPEPQPALFPRSARLILQRLLAGAELQEIAATSVSRTSRVVLHGTSEIEVSFDTGEIRAGTRTRPICELELELRAGRPADLLSLAATLPIGPGLRWSVTSKAQRAQDLAFDRLPRAVKPGRPRLTPTMTLALGFRAITWACLEHLIANQEVVLATGDVEAVHQCRVAVRRMRAAFGMFAALADDSEAKLFQSEIKALGRSLGRLRDLDVMIAQIQTRQTGLEPAADDLLPFLANRREQELDQARVLLNGEPFQRLLVTLASWLENGQWATTSGMARAGHLRNHARRDLRRRLRSLERQSARIGDLSDGKLHTVRKQIRSLRYVAEFVTGLGVKPTGAQTSLSLAKALGKAQNRLGAIQDAVAMQTVGREMFRDADPLAAARLEQELVQLTGTSKRERKKLLKAARRAIERATEMPGWWC